LTQPYFFRPGLAFDVSASSWWTSEEIYTSDVMGGRIGLSYRIGNRGRGEGRTPVDVVRVAYIAERVGYKVRPAVLEDLTNVDTLIGLGLDPITGEGNGTKAAIALDYERTATDNIANPRQGYSVALQYQEARPALGGTFDFRKMSAEARAYVPVGRVVVAGRVRAGTIVAESDADAPFSERYFLGGSTSLRGWGRYQISPLQDGIAVGGRTLLDSALELRVPVRDPFGVVLFIDAGNVWSESLAARTSGLRADAGVGLRYATPIGTVRGDIGFQLNPVEGLLVDGELQPRPWRIHLSIGQAF
jgi:outer membrane translocation and assembly module TamA